MIHVLVVAPPVLYIYPLNITEVCFIKFLLFNHFQQ